MATTINGSTGASQIQDDTVTTAKVNDSQITNALMADDAIGIAELSATGTASSSTFLRGDNAWAAPGGGGMTLLSTLTTTSGESHTTGTISLTGFKFVLITTQQVSHSSGTSQALQFTPNTGGAYGLGNYSIPSSFRWTSFSNIELATGTYTAFLPNDMAVPSQPVAFLSAGLGNNNAFTTSVTSISFGWSSGATFDAGSIRVYGLK